MSEPTRLASLNSLDGLRTAVEASHLHPVLLFKHSVYCDLSAQALDEVERFVATAADPLLSWVVVVQRARPLSDEVERQFRLRHESPQALILHRGVVVWHASHRRITGVALASALADTAEPAGARDEIAAS
jgi:bacillithiol system protein YtxJ